MILTTTPQVRIDPKKISFYSKKGKSMSFGPTYRMIDEDTDLEKDLNFVPPGIKNPQASSRETGGTPRKVSPDVVTTSQSNEE